MNIFNENTYKRVSVITKQNFLHSDVIVDYLNKSPQPTLIVPKYTKIKSPVPLAALIESKFARFDSILYSVKKLKSKYILNLEPHKIIIYGNNVSPEYISHVASIITWWAKIKPQTYSVTLYLTTIKKRLPPEDKPPVLSEEYVNSGFTYVAHPCDIHIFRREESLKVLIHELIHASKFDFHNSHLVDVPCILKDEDLSNEGITEYLAVIHYYWYIANLIKLGTVSDQFIELMSNDLGWQHYQISKILAYFNLQPLDLFNKNNYKQKTSVISYFLLKNFLFTQNSLPIILSRNVDEINKLILRMKDYVSNFELEKVPEDAISMRMTLYELYY